MQYCSTCGAKVKQVIPEGDNRLRAVCTACEMIHYVNPKVVVGVLPVWQEQVLLCRRAIEPRHGLWTLPAGFMENAEGADSGAAREAMEEANANLGPLSLYMVASLPYINQVYMMFRSELQDTAFSPGIESLETVLFTEDNIPWNEMAFTVVTKTLEHYFEDRKSGHYPVRHCTIEKPLIQT